MTADPLPATKAHAAALSCIHHAAFPPGEQWGPDAMALQLELPGAFGFVDLAGGMVLARVAADEAEILTLAVAPDARRLGLGTRLLRAAAEEASRRGAAAMFLEVAEDNQAARGLYAAAGFIQAGRRPRYYPGGRDAIVLRAALSRPGAAATR